MKNLIQLLIIILCGLIFLYFIQSVHAETVTVTYTITSKYAPSPMPTRVPAISPSPMLKKTTSRGDVHRVGNVEQLVESATREAFGEEHVEAMKNIVLRESGFNPYAVNKSSGACGLGQALPCSKMKCDMGDAECQIKWVVNYVRSRYNTPAAAWVFWQQHNWY